MHFRLLSIALILPALLASNVVSSAEEADEFACVVSPKIPKSVKLCGESIKLDSPDMRERYDRELTSMAYSHGNMMLMMKRAHRYFPMMKPILEQYGVPDDLVYLACIESTLNPRAVSSAKAAGLWQFMPRTAKEYGLEVNDYVDERFDPVKSTEAAARYLRNAYKRYGNWASTMASYNTGMNRISTELDAQAQSSALDLWLADETMRYVFRVMAAKELLSNPRHYGYHIKRDQMYETLKFRYIEVSQPVDDWNEWCAANNVRYRDLREYNPWIRAKSLPNKNHKTYRVAVPDWDGHKTRTSAKK